MPGMEKCKARDNSSNKPERNRLLYRTVKRSSDLACSVLLMFFFAPAAAVISAAIKAETPGSILFVHPSVLLDMIILMFTPAAVISSLMRSR